ncbi:MAG: TonB family protein [Alphaproteobacteria bacterium]|nr:TonB family protein [Alphaproteobacteria bacterium]
MERPSHIEMSLHQSPLQRLPILALAISLQIAIAWLFTSGLVNHVTHIADGVIDLLPIPEPKATPVEPPTPKLVTPPKVVVDLPQITVAREPSENTITATSTQPGKTTPSGTGAGVDRAPVSIASTHTTPPYPVAARRAGMEGNVTLCLTVLDDGHVGRAEVAVSSGHALLDEAAQAWIVGHWVYKPALKDGAPAVSHATALVTFSLENSR